MVLLNPIFAVARRSVFPALFVLAFMTAAPDAGAAPEYDRYGGGLKIGANIPHLLSSRDQAGKPRNFGSLKGKNGLILVFSRSVDWCRYCKAQAVGWNRRVKEARALGYNVTVITYDSVPRIARFVNRQNIVYPILSDKGSRIIKAFGILNARYQPGDFVYGIPHPIIFAIDRKGVIKHRFSGSGYRNRPDISLVLDVIRKSGAGAGS